MFLCYITAMKKVFPLQSFCGHLGKHRSPMCVSLLLHTVLFVHKRKTHESVVTSSKIFHLRLLLASYDVCELWMEMERRWQRRRQRQHWKIGGIQSPSLSLLLMHIYNTNNKTRMARILEENLPHIQCACQSFSQHMISVYITSRSHHCTKHILFCLFLFVHFNGVLPKNQPKCV